MFCFASIYLWFDEQNRKKQEREKKVKEVLDKILELIWGSEDTNKKPKRARDKKGRYTKRSKR